MALTITKSKIHPEDVWGALPIAIVTAVPAAGDYATGGYTLTPGAGIPLGSIFTVIPAGDTGGATGVLLKWNTTTQKLQAFWTGAAVSGFLAEVAATTDLSAFTFTLLILGINP
jgi:hypothetical protein